MRPLQMPITIGNRFQRLLHKNRQFQQAQHIRIFVYIIRILPIPLLGEREARYTVVDHSSLPGPAIAGLFFHRP
jgi:hypothetical protein